MALLCVADNQIQVDVQLSLRNPRTVSKDAPHARLLKPKQYGWWLVVGARDNSELFALKRLVLPNRGGSVHHTLTFPRPTTQSAAVFLLSDALVGLEHRQELDLPPPLDA